MALQLELGQVSDPYARRALETIALQWPDAASARVVSALPAVAPEGALAFLTSDGFLYCWHGGWKKT